MVPKYILAYKSHPGESYPWYDNTNNEFIQSIGNLLRIASTNSISYRKRQVCLTAAHQLLRLCKFDDNLIIREE